MTYKLSLHDRMRMARTKRDRYRRDPDYRLQEVNRMRSRRGLPPHRSVDEIEARA